MKHFFFSASFVIFALLLLSLQIRAQQLDNIKNEKPVAITGSIAANFITYNASGIDQRMDPFSMVLSGNAIISVYGLDMPFTFRYGNHKADYTQPFNQFGLSPSYKWVTLHAGYRNIRFSDFTLAGHTFLGGGIELNPGIFRFGAIYGRFKKSTSLFMNEVDSSRTFDRKGYAIKLGVGSKTNYVDLIFLKIADDSLSMTSMEEINPTKPEQNVVAGVNSMFTLTKHLTLDAEFSASLFTTDASIPSFVSNLDEKSPLQKADRLIVINESSEISTAARTSLNYKSKKFGLRAEYRRIGPKYKSMGTYYFNDDVESFTIAPSIPLFKRKLYIRGSLGLQHDNLKNSKVATTKRMISSANISYNPAQIFGVDLNYSNYSNNQKAGRVALIDSLKLYQTTSNLSLTPRLMIARTRLTHMIVLMINRSGLHDKNARTAEYSESVATIANLNYSINFNKSLLALVFGYNYTKLENFSGENKISGGTLGINKTCLKGALTAGLNNSIMRSDYMNEKGWIVTTSLNGNYQISKHHNFRTSLFLTNQKYPIGSLNKSFNEFKGDISYAYTF
jgi:hypothetical protein